MWLSCTHYEVVDPGMRHNFQAGEFFLIWRTNVELQTCNIVLLTFSQQTVIIPLL